MNFLEKIPNWLRWIMLLPVAWIIFLSINEIGMIVARILLRIGESIGFIAGNVRFAYAADIFLVRFIGGYVFVFAGAKIAPGKKFLVSIIMAVLFGIECYCRTIEKIYIANSLLTGSLPILAGIVGIAGAVAACYSFREELE